MARKAVGGRRVDRWTSRTGLLQVAVRLQRGRLDLAGARRWLGWEWLQAGWHKLVGGNLTGKFWNWGDPADRLTGDGNIG